MNKTKKHFKVENPQFERKTEPFKRKTYFNIEQLFKRSIDFGFDARNITTTSTEKALFF